MNDVAYRINATENVKKFGTSVVNNGTLSNLKPSASGSVFYRGNEWTVPNESPAGTGLVNRFDDPTYYSA
jgi:hypothetical protein